MTNLTKNITMKKPKLKTKEEIKQYSYGGAALSGATSGLGIASSVAPMAGPYAPIVMGAGALIGAGAGLINEKKIKEQQKQDEYNQYMNTLQTNQINNIRNAPLVEGAPPAAFANGGMKVSNTPTGTEVEKQEVMRAPDGSTMEVDGASHENGGVPVNIPNLTQIYSDRLKDKESGKTFAELASKYKVNKEDKIIEDKKATNLAKSTAELNRQIKQQKLSEIFNKQELLKKSKIASYAQKLGVDISQLSPKEETQEFANGGIKKYDGGGWATQPTQFNQVNPQSFYQDPGYTANYDGTNSGQGYSTEEGTFNAMGKQTKDPYGKNIPNPALAMIPGVVGSLANLAGPIYNLATNKQEKHFDYVTPDLKKYDPTQALNIANQENRTLREQARVNSGGNSAAYLTSLASLQSNLISNKANIQSKYDQMNTSAYNNLQPTIADIKNKTIDANQQNQARYRDINRAAVSNLGENVAGNMNDISKTAMDKYSLDLISKAYPDYEYNQSKRGWYHKTNGKKLTVSNKGGSGE